MWRHGPAGFDPLCNGCGVKWKRGRILRGCETRGGGRAARARGASGGSLGSSASSGGGSFNGDEEGKEVAGGEGERPKDLVGARRRSEYLVSALSGVPVASLAFVAAGLRRIAAVGKDVSPMASTEMEEEGQGELELDVGEMTVGEWGDVCGFLLGVGA
ncbi:hypothetical protein HK101_006648 [Irineochytrium annulatum]|nr:hypothetical protein HK101_006648 [Irineochytrium annulatum]